MSDEAKVSRKEKKLLRDAERQQKGKKRKHGESESVIPPALPENDAPEEEQPEAVKPKEKKEKSKKRKQDSDETEATEETKAPDAADSSAPKKKRRRKNKSKAAVDENGQPKPVKSRFIVFLGNLPYNTTDATLQAHFQKLMPFTLRHRTDPKTKKSKGFAFLEFEDYDRMKTCLKIYHHSMFDPDDVANGGTGRGLGRGGRKINVELTAGGGGSTEGRKEKIKVKNVRLEEQRERRADLERKEKAKKEANGEGEAKEAPSAPGGEASSGMHPSRLARLM